MSRDEAMNATTLDLAEPGGWIAFLSQHGAGPEWEPILAEWNDRPGWVARRLSDWLRALGTSPGEGATLFEVKTWLEWVERVALAGQALRRGEFGPFEAVRAAISDWLESLALDDWRLTLHAGTAVARIEAHGPRLPWTGVLARRGRCGSEDLGRDPDRTVAAWVRGFLHPEDADSLSQECREAGVFQTAYRAVVRRMASGLTVMRYPASFWLEAAGDDGQGGEPVMEVPLPHLGGSLRVVPHERGTFWLFPGRAPVFVASGVRSHRFGDEVVGLVETTLHEPVPTPSEVRRYMVVTARRLRQMASPGPREETVACGLAEALRERFGEALLTAASFFREGRDPPDDLLDQVEAAFEIRAALDDIGATLRSPRLARAIAEADDALTRLGAAEAVLVLPGDVVEKVARGLPVDTEAWWDRARALSAVERTIDRAMSRLAKQADRRVPAPRPAPRREAPRSPAYLAAASPWWQPGMVAVPLVDAHDPDQALLGLLMTDFAGDGQSGDLSSAFRDVSDQVLDVYERVRRYHDQWVNPFDPLPEPSRLCLRLRVLGADGPSQDEASPLAKGRVESLGLPLALAVCAKHLGVAMSNVAATGGLLDERDHWRIAGVEALPAKAEAVRARFPDIQRFYVPAAGADQATGGEVQTVPVHGLGDALFREIPMARVEVHCGGYPYLKDVPEAGGGWQDSVRVELPALLERANLPQDVRKVLAAVAEAARLPAGRTPCRAVQLTVAGPAWLAFALGLEFGRARADVGTPPILWVHPPRNTPEGRDPGGVRVSSKPGIPAKRP